MFLCGGAETLTHTFIFFLQTEADSLMRHSIYVPVLLTPLLVVAGCSTGHHGDGESHHNDEAGMASNAQDDHHGDADGDHHESAIGKPGNPDSVDRVIPVAMDDTMRFIPESFNVVAGETIQFDIVNNGQLAHEFVLGSADEIQEHHALMQKFPGMEHEEPNSVSLENTATGSVIWTFTTAGTVDIACLKPGHFEAGMKGKVDVSAK